MTKVNHISFFDLDDTLIHSDAKIIVMKDGLVVRELTNQEFNFYKLQEDEYYDFSQFESSDILKSSIPLKNNIEKILDLYNNNNEVIILTARGDFDDKDKVINTLRGFNIPVGHYKDGDIHIVRCAIEGLTPPEAKVIKVHKILDKRPEITSISLVDDSISNLKAIGQIDRVKVDLYLAKDNNIVKYDV